LHPSFLHAFHPRHRRPKFDRDPFSPTPNRSRLATASPFGVVSGFGPFPPCALDRPFISDLFFPALSSFRSSLYRAGTSFIFEGRLLSFFLIEIRAFFPNLFFVGFQAAPLFPSFFFFLESIRGCRRPVAPSRLFLPMTPRDSRGLFSSLQPYLLSDRPRL